ncbi:hypothetical protein LIPSTDRAFT_74041 [Lipomyces starkeyi NRRL Y-11557]|uniref:BED-type domain-containing protein n=1 Tax=Lipomyces starkeyi NRRL Y-11557 TaxID=675824 RepID=A0A1E3Q111_LIPST|nr:hypothetical protein LIPSTDRAFT_74041 [Lipomyces starkeyi NRRL Y-11557]
MDPPTRPRRNQAVDYLLLNDGYEGDEPTMMENILPGTAQSPVESSIDMGPEDSISQIGSQTVSTGLTAEAHDLESSPIQTASNSSQRTRGTSNSWLWEQFEITTLSQQWRPKRSKKLRSDQLITCKHCQKVSIKDSARSTSTTNMSYHLQKSHGLPLGNDKEDTTQPTIMTIIVREESHSLGRADKAAVYRH